MLNQKWPLRYVRSRVRKALIAAGLAGLALSSAAHAQGAMFLRQSTASQTRTIGPFLDPADGTAEGGLTIDAADVRIKVNGADDVAKNSGGCTHDINGMYECTFDATDTATVGEFNVSICETGAVCVSRTFWVYEEAVYDAFLAASAVGYVANAPVNVAQLSGDATAADLLELLLDTGATGNCARVGAWGIVAMGTASAYTAGTPSVTLHADCTDGLAQLGQTLLVRGSTGATYWQSAIVQSSSGDVATIDAAFATAPTGTIDFILIGTTDGAGGGLDAAGVRAAVGLASADLDTQLSNLQSDTDNIQTRLPTSLVSGRMDSSVGAYQSGQTPLQPTVADRTLDVTATGAAGIDWGNVENPTTTVALTGTTVDLVTGAVDDDALNSAAELQAAANAALVANHLDHLFQTTYDPASKPGAADALLNELVESDGGVARFTANALETAPSGSSITDFTANERSAIFAILGVAADNATPQDPSAGILDAIRDGVADVPTNAELTSALGELNDVSVADVKAALGIISGTCDSGTTAACVDDALTQADNTQLAGRLMCFEDDFCSIIGSFTPASDQANLTKTAAATRSGLAYDIFPATTE